MTDHFRGYLRPDGRVGTRNHLLVVPTVLCANVVAQRIEAALPSFAVALSHQGGCGQLGPDRSTTLEVLRAYCAHPNVGAVLVVGLGCEQIAAEQLVHAAEASGKPAGVIFIQRAGGTLNAIARGTELGANLAASIAGSPRQLVSVSDLTLGLKCGGSDFTSGIASNPVLGRLSDMLVERGAAAVLSETAEIMGAEQLLSIRARTPRVGELLVRATHRVDEQARALGVDIRGTQPSPGNIRGGLTTIEEKALGSAQKGGIRAPLVDVVEYGAPVARRPGLTFMDGPGLDVESVSGMVAAGATCVVFTTGLGTPTGNPVAPVIKITANAATASSQAVNVDLDVSSAMAGGSAIEDAAERLLRSLISHCSGDPTAAEKLGHREFAIYRRNSTI